MKSEVAAAVVRGNGGAVGMQLMVPWSANVLFFFVNLRNRSGSGSMIST